MAVAAAVLLVAAILALQALAPDRRPAEPAQLYVSPVGNDDYDGSTPDRPLRTIQLALDRARPGSTVNLGEGEYRQDVRTRRDGTASAPITLVGPPSAVVKGGGDEHVVEVGHDHHLLSGFTIDGRHGGDTVEGYRSKLVWVEGEDRDAVRGTRIVGMTIRNAAGECVRLKSFATGSEIAHSEIANCGVEDFRFGGDGKNGEGVYIGTAPEQLGDAGDGDDRSNGNHVHDNRIDTQGGECVDVKEGASRNVVERNSCTGQRDPESAGLDSRGNANVFRHNTVAGNLGAGVRLGGDSPSEGVDNDVYGNTIRDNASGGVKFMRAPQGRVCENRFSGNGKGVSVGEYGELFQPDAPCRR